MHFSLNRLHPNLSHDSRRFCHFSGDIGPGSWKSTEGLVRCPVNDVPLSPITFLERSATAYRDRTSVVYGSVKYTWSETHERCLKLASALTQLGISRGDVVAVLAPNVPAMYELHFGVPMAGAVLCTLNTRHNSAMVSTLLRHSEAKIIFVDYQLLEIAHVALDLLKKTETKPPILVLIVESDGSPPTNFSTSDGYEYESLLATGQSEFEIRRPIDEWDPISVNYTSGTTSSPKGVVYNHRGAYLNSLATFVLHGMGSMPVYLWTVPMFHCNGWCLPWGVAAQGGTNVCLRRVIPKDIFDSIALHKVTHMGGAPTVLNMIVNSPVSDRRPLPSKVEVMTGGSPPPPPILRKMEELGFGVSHLYGLTETYGPGTICTWKPEWDSLPPDERYKLKARQGVQHLGLEEVDIKDPVTMKSVAADGNTVMSGYLKDEKATEEAFRVDGFEVGILLISLFLEENISTVEVETVLYNHPAILETAVVARPDNHWGQTPCAFVKLKEDLIYFEDLPRTSTGKIQKFILREKAKALGSLS
ncbi:hypothetical protein AAG906_025364 [Vitis piasezkii]